MSRFQRRRVAGEEQRATTLELFYDLAAAVAQRRLELAADRILTARDAYTYLHVVIVLGVIVAAVGDELVIANPTDVLPGEEVAAVVAGPAIYLLALSLFDCGWPARSARHDCSERSPASRSVGWGPSRRRSC